MGADPFYFLTPFISQIAITNDTGEAPVTTTLYYSAAWQVLEESVAGVYTQRYVWSPVYVNALVLRDTDTSGTGLTATGSSLTRYWVVQDANWNVVALVDGSGTVVERYDYTPFGVVTVLNADGSVKTGGTGYNWVYLFQGGRLDPITGDYSFQERKYDPVLGRWTTMDPLGFGGRDQDLYRVENNGPVNRLDLSGEGSADDAANWYVRNAPSWVIPGGPVIIPPANHTSTNHSVRRRDCGSERIK